MKKVKVCPHPWGPNHHAPLPAGVRAPAWSTCERCGARVYVRGLKLTAAGRRWLREALR